ncbi:MAG: Fatty acid desaturase [Candidatus Uhrbacteria bacterium GW2011_GWF2_39_13]|uniref:Fatty acid desaturase n=1 Tax=Candidatus Uhrbacteria bacterium GW2011_GWF2_39_13 TaxID=1618995 RepID=A0A0G0MNQ1_9BACT|nr:MAG: Fatty acid desaturase [Candidatus Uhrbacteria bacterium GW2011_GWF2_39_13]
MFRQPGMAKPLISEPQWYQEILKYEKPDLSKSIFQIFSSLAPYIAIWVFIVWMINKAYAWWLLLPVGAIASIFLVRIFIIFHDCTHNSFFVSRKTNRFWGYVITPFERWQHSHNIHHNSYADLDHRGVGDVWTLTMEEYLRLPLHRKIAYRLYRNPFIMFGLGPAYVFLFDHRFSLKGSGSKGRSMIWPFYSLSGYWAF